MSAAGGSATAARPGGAEGAAAESAAATSRRVRTWLESRWLTLAVGLCAAGPVIAATLRALAHGWLPAGDQAIIATRAYDVLTSRTPLVGQHSDASSLIHHTVYSLGPMLFWLLAVPVRLASPWSLTATMCLLNTAAIIGSVVLARRRGGRMLMFATALAIVVMSRSLAPETLHDVWNPSAGLFPFTVLIFLCWSIACGEYRLLPLAVLVASFVVQCQLTYLAPTALLAVVALAGLLVSLRARRSRTEPQDEGTEPQARAQSALPDALERGVSPGTTGGRPHVRRFVLAAVLVGAVCWAPPVIDQLDHSPGNITEVVRAARATHNDTVGATVGWRTVVLAVGVRPWWTTDPASPWQRKVEVRKQPDTLATVSTVLLLCALAVLALLGALRRRVDVWAGALMCLALCAALAAVAASTPNTRLAAATLGYTLWWGSPAGMFVWLFTAFAAVSLWARRPLLQGRSPRLVATVGIATVVICALAVAAGQRADEHLQEYRPLKTMFAALDRWVPAGRTVLLTGALGDETFRFKMAARFALRRRGIHPLSPGTDTRLGSWYELDHRRYDCTVYVKDGRASPARGAVRLTSFVYAAVHPLSVWILPAGCPTPGTAAAPGTYPETWVSYGRLLAQVRSGPLVRAIINPASSDAEIKFRNLEEWHAYYPSGAQPTLQRILRERHVRLLFVPRSAPHRAATPAVVHHHLRYILAAALLAAAAIAAAALLLGRRRRRGGGGAH